MRTNVRRVARTVWQRTTRLVREWRFGDPEKVAFFEATTSERQRTAWPRWDATRRWVLLLRGMLAALVRTHRCLLRENRVLPPDPLDAQFHGLYGKFCIGHTWKAAFSLLQTPRGRMVLDPGDCGRTVYLCIGRQQLASGSGTLTLTFEGAATVTLLTKQVRALPQSWGIYSLTLPDTHWNPDGPNYLQWHLSVPARVCISTPMRRAAGAAQRCIVLIADAVRPNDLGIYAGGDSVTPQIDRFFSEGAICGRSVAQGNWTLPACASMALSQYASQHGVVDPDQYATAMPRSVPTLAELFRQGGFFTYGSVSHRRCHHALGHHRGFDHFRYAQTVESAFRSPGVTGDNNATAQLRELCGYLRNFPDVDCFAWVHCFDTHFPYFSDPLRVHREHHGFPHALDRYIMKSFRQALRPEEYDFIRAQYFRKLAEFDAELRQLFAMTESMDNTTVMLLSDHGYSFENPLGNDLSLEEIRTPWLMRSTQFPLRGRVDGWVESSIDLLPTLVRLYNLTDEAPRAGHAVVDRDGVRAGKDCAVSELIYDQHYRVRVLSDDGDLLFGCPRDRATGVQALDQMALLQPSASELSSAAAERVVVALQNNNLPAPIRGRLVALLEDGRAKRAVNQ